MGKYHDKQKLWHSIKNSEPLSAKQKEHIACMQIIGRSIFGKFDARKINDFINSPNCNKEEAYQELFGMSKETFEKILSILQNAHTKRHSGGGRPSNMNLVEKVAVTVEYLRYNRAMDEMASYYGVSKRQICEAVNWVIKTLESTESTDI